MNSQNGRPLKVIAAIARVPPPMSGLTAVNAKMISILRETFEVISGVEGPIAVSSLNRLRLFVRISEIQSSFSTLIEAKRRGARIVYLPLDAGLGIIANILVVIHARLAGMNIFFHHHSFAYINGFSFNIWLVLLLSPKSATHIFLCDEMATLFKGRYWPVWHARCQRSHTLPNAFMVDDQNRQDGFNNPRKPIVLGHLSNLSESKGILTVIEVFRIAASKINNLKLVIGGASNDRRIQREIDQLLEDFPVQVTSLGHVEGDAKAAFYRQVDLFLFPTEYKNEAQPLVLLEALAAGCAIASINRGCIGCDHAESVGLISSDRADFLKTVPSWITALNRDRIWLNQLQQAALSTSVLSIQNAERTLQSLLVSIFESA